MPEWRAKGTILKLWLTDKVATAVIRAKKNTKNIYIYIYKHIKIKLTTKKALPSRYRAYGDIVYVPDNTRDNYRGFPLGRINASGIK